MISATDFVLAAAAALRTGLAKGPQGLGFVTLIGSEEIEFYEIAWLELKQSFCASSDALLNRIFLSNGSVTRQMAEHKTTRGWINNTFGFLCSTASILELYNFELTKLDRTR